MKHASSRELFEYWKRRRRGHAAPDRSDIEPGAIRKSLADIFILSTDAQSPVFRLAGTRVCALFGRELKGEDFLALWEAVSARELRQLIRIVGEETSGLVGGASALVETDGDVPLELLLLPLRHRQRYDLRMIGMLAPLGEVSWLGAVTLDRLVLQSYRHLDPDAEAKGLLAQRQTSSSARQRHGFFVYDGSRS